MRSLGSLAALAVGLVVLASPALAQRAGKGQGAIVIRDDAPVYADSKGDKIEWKLRRGDAVAGFMMQFLKPIYQLDEVDGRVHVLYFQNAAQKGTVADRTAWMDPKDLSRFTYDGTCGLNGSPFVVKGFGSKQWNACFQEARDNKLDTLRVLWAQQDAAAKTAPAPEVKPAAQPEAKTTPAVEPSLTPAPSPAAAPPPSSVPSPSPKTG